MKTSDFDYILPPDQIAQTPLEPRHSSRLLVLRQGQNVLEHSLFWKLDEYLAPGDLLVINQTRVIPARIFAHKSTGGKVEILLLNRQNEQTWEVLVGGKGLVKGKWLQVENGPQIEIVTVLDGSKRLVHFSDPIESYLGLVGQMPLPPYIHTPLKDPERYQTVYARQPGSTAAPTAGLHFTTELMKKLENKGILFAEVTLHVGLDTFAPVNEEDPQQHKIHMEWCEVTSTEAEKINLVHVTGGKIIAVGTTSVRTLETAAFHARPGQLVGEFSEATSLFILPGYQFRVIDAMITNFHLPRSTLLMMVSAFAGRERILAAYQTAIKAGYRFYSFGDAMLIV